MKASKQSAEAHPERPRSGRVNLDVVAMVGLLLIAARTDSPAEETSGPLHRAAVSISAPDRFKAGGMPDAKRLANRSSAVGGANPWWEIFHDSTLSRLEAGAVASNEDLRQAVARVLEARSQAKAAAASFYPTVTAPLRATRERTTGTGPVTRSRLIGNSAFSSILSPPGGSSAPDSFAGQALANTFNDFQAPLAASYEIDVFGRIRHTYGQARALAEASQADRRAVELSLTTQIAANYFNLRTIDSQDLVLRRALQLRAEAVQLQSERFKAGAASDLDQSRAQLEQANTEADLSDTAQRRVEAENALAVLCGRSASEFHLPVQPLDEGPPPSVPAGLPAQLLTRRPDLVEAERRIAGSREGVKIAHAEFLPTVTVQANYGYESAKSDQLFDSQSRAWSITGGISIPIFDGGLNTAHLQGAEARRDETLAAYRQTALTAFKEAENALSSLRNRTRQADARERASKDARRVFEGSQERYREGAIDYFEVIDAQRGLLDAELAQVGTLSALYSATIDLIRAIGGGYGGVEPATVPVRKHPSQK